MNNPYIKPLEFDAGGWAEGALGRYLIITRVTIDGKLQLGVIYWGNNTPTLNEDIGREKTRAGIELLANRHNAEQIARFLTTAGRERLGL